tara:strand:- start:22954 stop:23328 length:375 start_codon:yes stop_codon:yes gene_type:complete
MISSQSPLNVYGNPLKSCSCSPMTGWHRDGFCKTDSSDIGEHTICAVMNKSFLSYSYAQGNDLITPMPQYSFPGLKVGDHWCLCAERWKQAYDDGIAPMLILDSTEISVLSLIELEVLEKFSLK